MNTESTENLIDPCQTGKVKADSNVSYTDYRFEKHNPSVVTTPGRNESTSTVPSDLDSVAAERERRVFGVNERFLNVLLLGVGFMFSVGALQTCGMAQTVILHSVQDDYFQGSSTMGYILLAIQNAAQAIAYFFSASLCAVIGPKLALVAGSICISLNIACYLRPFTATVYVGAVVVGLGSGVMWAVQGHFVSSNSRSRTVERNMALFWGLLQTSSILGSLFYFLMLRGSEEIEPHIRWTVISTLLGASIIGIFVFSLIRQPWFAKLPRQYTQLSECPAKPFGPKEALVRTIRLAMRRDMLLLIPHFFYIGFECTMWASVYSTSLGYTKAFGIIRQSLVGLNGVFLGLGEISASIALMLIQ
ncbi:putative UNC93-like protein MFSD11 [Hypsibius exemplaris]|uniref:UNC93-like protein MFSD11 n=1 Tax=Hypsibius exemplaris TaxID=2072580 RepID=A0A1W0WYF2_HYPEX|nr:putative UNC93-like protein MFSD11 [Hypsibius exemplaris]